jgi:hypothetical protein
MKNQLLIIAISGMCCAGTCLATSDSTVINANKVNTTNKVSYINRGDCIVLQSSPYVIVAGNGGGNMNLTCPAERPVVSNWRFEVGYGGILAVNAGGGQSWITCCSVGHKWET